MKTTPVVHAALLTVVTISILVVGCGQEEVVMEGEIIRPVKTMVVSSARSGVERTFSGTIRAGQEASLAFRVSGKVDEVMVEVGDKVNKGRLLARLDPHNYQLSVKNIESNLASAQAAYKNSRSSYQRRKNLYENSNISKSQLDQYETQRNSDLSQVNALNAHLEQARNQLSYAALKAPFKGYISARKIDEFENIAAGQSIFTLVDPVKLKVDIGIPESLIVQVKDGDSVSIVVESLPGREFPGSVAEVGVALDANTGTYPVVARITNPVPGILPGMAAEVTFSFAFTALEGFVVPTSALLEDIQTGDRYLWIFREERVKKYPVQTGKLVADGIEIVSGLKGGEAVVTAGVHSLEEGQKVKVLE